MKKNSGKAGKQRLVMVFGAFDRLHPGHLFVLYHARLLGDRLIAVVARSSAIRSLKGRLPRDSDRKRAANVRQTALPSKTVLGDVKQGSYAVIHKYKPDIIAVGYDQEALAADLKLRIKNKELPPTDIVRLRAYQPRRFHTSLLA